MDPFSAATTQPKIPDGVFNTSLSRRLQNVIGINNDTGANAIMHIIMGPTMGCPLMIMGAQDGLRSNITGSASIQHVGFPGQTVGYEWTDLDNVATWFTSSGDIPVSNTYSLNNLGGYSSWRIVSQGLRLELTNNDQENEGWYEACRFNWQREPNALCLTSLDGTGTNPNIGFAPSPRLLDTNIAPLSEDEAYMVTGALTEQTGYTTGLLKDIKDVQFMLHPQSVNHDPVLMNAKEYKLIHGSYGTTSPSNADGQYSGDSYNDVKNGVVNLSPDKTIGVQLMKENVDPNMDWIYIRLHCRRNISGNTTNRTGSNFICHLQQNVEIQFDPKSDLVAFQTINQSSPLHATVHERMHVDTTASMSRRK